MQAAQTLDATVVNMRFIKPLDLDMLRRMALSHDALVTVEEGTVLGGAGSACMEALQSLGMQIPVLNLGLPDAWLEHGDPAQITAQLGLDAVGLLDSIRTRFPGLVGDHPDAPRRAANA